MIIKNQHSIVNHKFYLWLGVSLLFTIYYGAYFYYYVFSNDYIVQDDARQHIVWLQRFSVPGLFPQDIIANYFSSLAPLGFKTLYILAAKIGIQPVLLAKLLPPILSVVTTVYTYLFTLKILPLPITGFFSSLFINQLIWLNDDLVSATHRAFIYPLFAAFLYYFSKQLIIYCLILMLLQGLFYPHILLIEIAIFSLILLKAQAQIIIQFAKDKQLDYAAILKLSKYIIFPFPQQIKNTSSQYPKKYIWWLVGLIISAIALFPITQKPPELATVVTVSQMQQMPEFNLGGRNAFFGGGWFQYWFMDSSGLSLPLFPPIVWTGLALPFCLKIKLPVTKLVTNKLEVLKLLTIASLLMFILAHIFLPSLHLPSRYTYHTLRFVLAISTGIVLTIVLNLGKNWLKDKRQLKRLDSIKITFATLFALTVIIFPAIPYVFTSWFQNWKVGTAPEIYQYLAQQPKNTLVASLSEEANNIPAFSQRSILTGREFAMAYHPSYYSQIEKRTVDLLQAQYSFNIQVLQSFIQKYDIDYWLLDKDTFSSEYLFTKDWLLNSSFSEETSKMIEQLEIGSYFALSELVSSCSTVSTDNLDLLDTTCILDAK